MSVHDLRAKTVQTDKISPAQGTYTEVSAAMRDTTNRDYSAFDDDDLITKSAITQAFNVVTAVYNIDIPSGSTIPFTIDYTPYQVGLGNQPTIEVYQAVSGVQRYKIYDVQVVENIVGGNLNNLVVYGHGDTTTIDAIQIRLKK